MFYTGFEHDITYMILNFNETNKYNFVETIDQTPFIPKENPKNDFLKIKNIQIQGTYETNDSFR